MSAESAILIFGLLLSSGNLPDQLGCPEAPVVESGFAAPDTGIYGTISREEASYRKLIVPRYPAKALKNKVAGTVFVHVWIREDRVLSDVSIEAVRPASATQLVEGLVDTIRSWQFNPIEVRGNPIASEVIVPVRFRFKGQTVAAIANRPTLPGVMYLDTIEVVGDPEH
jgi:TonB family protein